MNNSNNNNFNAGNDFINSGEINNVNKQNKENNIDKRKTINKFTPEYKIAWANPYNQEALLYKRLPNINDRPMLEKYYKNLKLEGKKYTKPIIFYGYVAEKRSNVSYTLLNIVNEYGNLMACHTIVKGTDLKAYLLKLIKFEGMIEPYNENNENGETKYGIKIIDNTIEIVQTKRTDFTGTLWDDLFNKRPNDFIDIIGEFEKYNNYSIEDKFHMLLQIEQFLNDLSWSMFYVPNLIFPLATSLFLMRDDIYNAQVIVSNLTHLNMVLTRVADYIVELKPKTYLQTIQIVYYVVLNYLGYDFNKPNDKEKFYEMTHFIGVAETNADHYLDNAKTNTLGIISILERIPSSHRTKPGDIHVDASFQFAKRIHYNK